MKKVMVKNFETGEMVVMNVEEVFKGRVSANKRVAAELIKIGEDLDELAHRLFFVSGGSGIDERLKGNLESKAEALSCISTDILRHII